MSRQQNETTPLLWPSQRAFPGSGAFPAMGQFPNVNGNNNSQLLGNPYQFYSRYGGVPPRPGTPQQNSKQIHHDGDLGKDPHSQFCALTGCPPTNAPPDFKYKPNEKTLYGRAIYQVRSQTFTYQLTAALTNTLLLLQIVLGAALTGLGGAGVPSYVITIFGAANTVIAGIVAYLKSRGQPMRSRMFRDDLERVVDEIENSEVMWLGIAKGVHGYDDIDTDEEVTVRSEVARLTRLLDKAIRNNTQNNPDLYSSSATGNEGGGGGTSSRMNPYLTLPSMGQIPVDSGVMANVPAMPTVQDADAAPATSSKSKKDEEARKKAEDEAKKKKEKEEEEKKKKEEEEKKKKEEEENKKKEGEKTAVANGDGSMGASAGAGEGVSATDDKGKQSIMSGGNTFTSMSGGMTSSKTTTTSSSTLTGKPPGSLEVPNPKKEAGEEED